MTPDEANKASKRPGHGLDLLYATPGSAAMMPLEPGVFAIAPGAGVFAGAPPTAASQLGIATPSPTPPAVVTTPGFPVARTILTDTLLKLYPHADPRQILAAADVAVTVMETTWTGFNFGDLE